MGALEAPAGRFARSATQSAVLGALGVVSGLVILARDGAPLRECALYVLFVAAAFGLFAIRGERRIRYALEHGYEPMQPTPPWLRWACLVVGISVGLLVSRLPRAGLAYVAGGGGGFLLALVLTAVRARRVLGPLVDAAAAEAPADSPPRPDGEPL